MNRDRWENIERARTAYERGATTTSEGPIEAFFEIAARCNLRCQMCAINYDARYKNSAERPAIFAPELFGRLAGAFPTLVRAYLFGLGEPLLNPHLPEYVRRLASTGVEVWFNTNATLIDDEKAEELAAAGAGRITVSIDGATRETYERIRRGGSFDAVTRGIRALVEAGRRHGRPNVNLSFVAMRSNIEELPLMADLCAELGATGVHVEPLYAQQQPELEAHYRDENLATIEPARVEALLAEAMRRASGHGVDIVSRFLAGSGSFDYVERAPTLGVSWICTEPWSSIWVTAAGEVRTCCINETSFGNLLEQSFDEIWNGNAFRRFREQHATRTTEPAGCSNCIRNGRPRHSPYFKTVEAVTYRPLQFSAIDSEPPSQIDWPPSGAIVTDPLIVTGRRTERTTTPVHWELMIDRQVVGSVDDESLTDDGSFLICGAAPYLTEGAHVLWLREGGGDDPRGWGHREVFFWRGGTDSSAIAVTSLAALQVTRARRPHRVLVNGHPWRNVSLALRRGGPPVLLVDTSTLESGIYDVELRGLWWQLATFRLERLGVASPGSGLG